MTEMIKHGEVRFLHGQLDNDCVRLVRFLSRVVPRSASAPSIWMHGKPNGRAQRELALSLLGEWFNGGLHHRHHAVDHRTDVVDSQVAFVT